MMSLFPVIALIGFILHLWRDREPRTAHRAAELLLVHLMVFVVGLGGLLAFSGHMFMSDKVALGIGWPAGNPFQLEVAMTNLSYAILGLLCIGCRGLFPVAAGIGYCAFLFGAAYVHIRDTALHQNHAAYNSGAFLYVTDLLLPTVLLLVVIAYWITLRGKQAVAPPPR